MWIIFFAALRIYRNINTGYAQIVLKAIGWNERHKTFADLPVVDAQSFRFYPAFFEKHYWLQEDIPTLNVSDIPQLKTYFSRLIEIKSNNLSLAIKRLNRCLIREDEEDSILDACMALETLLSDGKTEIQHKLALRMAALASLSPNSKIRGKLMFRAIKDVYEYRSAVIHGNNKVNKKREIISEGGENIPALAVAIDCLRMALGVLIEHPEYLEPTKIDEELILQRLT